MTIYIAEINGRAVAAINAENSFMAEDCLGGPEFHSELLRLRDGDDNPLWDGEAEIHVRPARSQEEEIWEHARGEAEEQVDEDQATVVVFLIPVFDHVDLEDTDNDAPLLEAFRGTRRVLKH